MARRSFCSQAHAVSYDPNPRTRCRPNADIPFFCDVRNQMAANHVDNGVRIRWKIVPAVTDVCRPQAAHIHLPFAVCHARVEVQDGQTKPSGHRNRARYWRQARSSGNHAWSSWNVRG